jgi:hypothetical protein
MCVCVCVYRMYVYKYMQPTILKRRGTKNCEIALKIVQNLSAHEETGEELLRQGALDQALESARTGELKVCDAFICVCVCVCVCVFVQMYMYAVHALESARTGGM